MATYLTDNVRKLLSQYTFKTITECKGEDLTCTICSKLMTDAYQTHCGCKYCRQCIVEYLKEGNNYCPGGKDECQEDLLVLDLNVNRLPSLNRKILNVQVHCPNTSCVFISTLAVMDDHLRLCGQQPLKCPYVAVGCGSEAASKDKIETHFNNETFSHSELMIEAINNLRNEIGDLREELRLSEVARVEMQVQVEEEKKLRREEKAELMGRIEQLEEQKNGFIIELEKQKNDINMMKSNVEKRRDSQTQTFVPEDKVGTMRREVEERGERSAEMKADDEVVKEPTVVYRDNNKERSSTMKVQPTNTVDERKVSAATIGRVNRVSVNEKVRTISALHMGTNTVIGDGPLVFAVDRWAARMRGVGETVYSPYLYSHTKGYKLRLEVHPRGSGEGAGTHLSVSSVVCKGEYDAVLAWPCTKLLIVSVINQRTMEAHRTQAKRCCSINKDKFSRPNNTDNPSDGWLLFVSHADLQSTDGLVVNDSVLLRLVVAPPPIEIVSFNVDHFRARRAANETVWSPYFYTHIDGYKVRVRVHPGGWGDGRGKYMSVYSLVCKGDNDDTLEWPCRYGIAFSVINQRTNEAHRTRTNIYCDIYQSSFRKPINKDNDPLGGPTFVSHADLDSIEGLVVNDSVIIRIGIIPPQ